MRNNPTKAVIRALKQLVRNQRTGIVTTSTFECITGLFFELSSESCSGGHILTVESNSTLLEISRYLRAIGEGPKMTSEKAMRSKRLNFAKLRLRGALCGIEAFQEWAREYGERSLVLDVVHAHSALEHLIESVNEIK